MKKIIIAILALTSAVSYAQPKFAHVDFSALVQLMPEADSARETMNLSQKDAQDTFQELYQEYMAKAQAFQQNAQTWNQTTREMKEKELGDLQQRIEEFNQNIQAELAQQQQNLMAPIQKKALDVVNALAKEGGYIYVIDRNNALYIDDTQSTDLTAAARKALNIPEDRTLESLYAELQAQQQATQQLQ